MRSSQILSDHGKKTWASFLVEFSGEPFTKKDKEKAGAAGNTLLKVLAGRLASFGGTRRLPFPHPSADLSQDLARKRCGLSQREAAMVTVTLARVSSPPVERLE